MTIYEEVKCHLEKYPTARERSNKNRFIAWILWKKLKGCEITKEILEKFVVDVSSYDRAWRQVLQHEPKLRGRDYGEKEILEQKKEIELGYIPGFGESLKILEKL